VADLRGQPPQPFKFKILGMLAAIGKRTGVAEILGMRFSGFIAWWLWRCIYLGKLPGFSKKVRVGISWVLDNIFSKDIVQLPTLRSPTVSHAEEVDPPGRVTGLTALNSKERPLSSRFRIHIALTVLVDFNLCLMFY
jgi:hypothetical protein